MEGCSSLGGEEGKRGKGRYVSFVGGHHTDGTPLSAAVAAVPVASQGGHSLHEVGEKHPVTESMQNQCHVAVH